MGIYFNQSKINNRLMAFNNRTNKLAINLKWNRCSILNFNKKVCNSFPSFSWLYKYIQIDFRLLRLNNSINNSIRLASHTFSLCLHIYFKSTSILSFKSKCVFNLTFTSLFQFYLLLIFIVYKCITLELTISWLHFYFTWITLSS